MQAVDQRLNAIQAARGVAALLVVLLHGSRMLDKANYGYPLGGFFSFGHAGVDFFFVLSGFIIYYVHYQDFGQPLRLPRYLWRRITRIYPTYWIITVFLIANALMRHPDIDLSPSHFLGSFFLIQHQKEPYLDVAWTLEHEVLFYAAFAIAIWNRRIGVAIFSVWAAMILAGLIWDVEPLSLRFICSFVNLQFFFGMGCAYIVLNRTVRGPLLLTAIGIAGFLATGLAENAGIFEYSSLPGHFWFGIFSALIIVGLACAEMSGLISVPPLWVFFGTASYSLYLVHTIGNGFSAEAMIRLGLAAMLPSSILLLLCAAASVTLASLFCYFIEQPLMHRLQSIGRAYVYPERLQQAA